MDYSFVVPIYNERDSIEELAARIAAEAAAWEFEILLVDDGSTDGSLEVMQRLAAAQPEIEVIALGRNAGKSVALQAGFDRARGDIVFTLDGDLQDDPKEIPRFIEKLAEGCDLVTGWKEVRNDPWHKTIPSRIYNGVVARLFGLPLHDVNCGFKAMRREVARSLQLHGGRHRLIPVIAARLGYTVAEIPVLHHPRRHGKSKYGLERFTRGAIDVAKLWLELRRNRTRGNE